MPPRPAAREPDSRESERLVVALARQGRRQEVVQHSEDALRLNPDYPEAHLNMTAALQRLGRDAEAQRRADRARSTVLPPGR